MDILIPVVFVGMCLFIGNEMRARGIPKFGLACVALSFAFAFSFLLGVPKEIYRVFLIAEIVVVAVGVALVLKFYRPPAQ